MNILGQSPTSNSTPLNNAAKDDVISGFTFSIADLLANDPGGAAKTAAQFFFGDTAADRDDQAGYLADHGITNNGDGTYTINAGAEDFSYFVQIGKNGTWSQGDVDITAPVPHLGDALFTENFDGYGAETQQTYFDNGEAVFAAVNLNTASGWTGTANGGAANSELGADGYGGIETTSGTGEEAFWLDSQNTPGQIDISHTFTDSTAAIDGGAQYDGNVTSVLSFDIAKQDLTYLGNQYQTEGNASFEFKVDGVTVAHIDASQLATNNDMYHFEVPLAGYADMGDDIHTLSLVDTSSQVDVTGFAIDSIAIHDWVV